MQSVSNSHGSDSESDESSETESSEHTSTRSQQYKDLVRKANSVDLRSIFKAYSIKLDEQSSRKTICPFPKHQGKERGGRESSPSFYFYADTNSFWCFGCKTGVYATDFVAAMDNCNRVSAALKILELFDSDTLIEGAFKEVNYSERLDLLISFSNSIREFIQDYSAIPSVITYAEKLTGILDRLNEKHDLDNTALKQVIDKLTSKMELYK